MRIAIGGILHESSTCVDSQTTLHEFEYDRGIVRGEKLLSHFKDTNVCLGGFLAGAERHGFELVPLLRASAFPGGPVRRADYESLKGELVQCLVDADRESRVDGVLLDLHGAMVVEGIEDGDGDVVAAVRAALGPDRPLIFTQDLHGNHTQLRVDQGDALIGYDTFPHVDMAERGEEAADLIVRAVNGEVQPVSAICRLPLYWCTPCQVTAHPPMDDVIRELHAIEGRDGILSATVATGFPWADVPDAGSSVTVVADGDRELAQRTADEFGSWIWEQRQRWYTPPVSVRAALREGEQRGDYPIILADHSDNTGGGSPGDSTEVLQTFLDENLERALLLYFVQSDVAQQAHDAGVGEEIDVVLGGRYPAQGPAVQATARVLALTDGRFAYDGPMFAGLQGSMGMSAAIQIDGVTVLVVTAREQPFDMAFARTLGIDCAAMKYISVKSAAHFRAAFEPIAGWICNVDAAGIHTHDFAALPGARRIREIFPINQDAEFETV
ncbi:MAG: M81 family metallopeptidase [Pirellulaceae bacterium]|nr:M81 family metallopeptidase [Pirellulaceae bacterium]MDP7017400.1 M81 family metallopeptidase [Pirellulaceae bacterium]